MTKTPKIAVYHPGTLKVRLTRNGRTLTAKVLEQSEELRGMHLLAKSPGAEIRSVLYPATETLSDETICLFVRGVNYSDDTTLSHHTYPTIAKAKAAQAAFKRLIAAINEKPEEKAPEPVKVDSATAAKSEAFDRLLAIVKEWIEKNERNEK